MAIKVGKDYALGLANIKDKSGNDAAIDGAPTFVVNPEAGEILIASGDSRVKADGTQAFPDGTPFFRANGAVDTVVKLEGHVDPNLNPTITDDKKVAELTDVLVAGDASVASLVLGEGVDQP